MTAHRRATLVATTPAPYAAGAVLALVAVAMFYLRPAMAEGAATASRTFAEAERLIDKDRGADAVPILQELAESGDARAQVMLGVAYSEGSWLPRDPLQSYVWLRIAVSGHRGAIQRLIMLPQARELELRAAGAIDGAALIKGDTMAGEFLRVRNRAWDESFERGVRGEAGNADPLDLRFPFQAGRAALPAGSRYKSLADDAGQPRCTGALEANPDVKVTAAGKGAKIFQPNYPRSPRRHESHVGVLAHVDRSGWVCYAKVVDSSDDAEIDQAAIEAVSQWRFVPASKAGEPVESLYTVYNTLKVVP